MVFVATDDDDLFIKASVDSSETGAWSVPVSLDNGAEYYAQHRQDAIAHEHYCIPYVQPRRVALIGDDIYLTLRRDNAIIKYDRAHHCLSMINPLSPNVGNGRKSLMHGYGGWFTGVCLRSGVQPLSVVKEREFKGSRMGYHLGSWS